MPLTWHHNIDDFGYPHGDGFRTEFVGVTSAQGWFGCYKYDPSQDDTWFFYPVPQFMTVRRIDLHDGEIDYCTFGVHEFHGRLDRMDTRQQFIGYAHDSEFITTGVLTPEAKQRLAGGEVMCGDMSRLQSSNGRLTIE